MRTNIDIDDAVLQAAMRGSEFKTKKEAVEAGLKLLARQAHYREVLKWEGKLHWDDQPDPEAAKQFEARYNKASKQVAASTITADRKSKPAASPRTALRPVRRPRKALVV